jgi:hypothetical protein
LLFLFEPNFSQATLISSDATKMNQQNTLIVDIQNTRDIEITMDYQTDVGFKFFDFNEDEYTHPNCTVNGTTLDRSRHNALSNFGWLQVRPLNELVQPTDDAGVYINCFVKSNDMEYCVPRGLLLNGMSRTYTETESGVVSETINHVDTDNDHIYEQYMGEKVESFRSLLRRYHTISTYIKTFNGNDCRVLSMTRNMYPTISSYPSVSTALVDANAVPHLYDYLRWAYMGCRGGYRYRFIITGDGDFGSGDWVTTSILPAFSGDNYDPSWTEGKLSNKANLNLATRAPLDGAVRHNPQLSGGIDVEIPYYSSDLFRIAFAPRYGTADLPYTLASGAWPAVNLGVTVQGDQTNYVGLTVDAASAEDFTFLRFQGAPFYVTDTPI